MRYWILHTMGNSNLKIPYQKTSFSRNESETDSALYFSCVLFTQHSIYFSQLQFFSPPFFIMHNIIFNYFFFLFRCCCCFRARHNENESMKGGKTFFFSFWGLDFEHSFMVFYVDWLLILWAIKIDSQIGGLNVENDLRLILFGF